MSPWSKDVLLARRAQRDPSIADSLLRRLSPRVFQVVYMVVSTSQEAEDLVQMCLLEIMEHLHKYRGEGALESWAGQLSYRVIMRQLTRQRRRESRFITVAHDQGESGQNTERDSWRVMAWERLDRHLGKIPPQRRLTLLLRFVQGCTVAETAELTDVSINTAKQRLRTGVEEIRAIFQRDRALKDMFLEGCDG